MFLQLFYSSPSPISPFLFSLQIVRLHTAPLLFDVTRVVQQFLSSSSLVSSQSVPLLLLLVLFSFLCQWSSMTLFLLLLSLLHLPIVHSGFRSKKGCSANYCYKNIDTTSTTIRVLLLATSTSTSNKQQSTRLYCVYTYHSK